MLSTHTHSQIHSYTQTLQSNSTAAACVCCLAVTRACVYSEIAAGPHEHITLKSKTSQRLIVIGGSCISQSEVSSHEQLTVYGSKCYLVAFTPISGHIEINHSRRISTQIVEYFLFACMQKSNKSNNNNKKYAFKLKGYTRHIDRKKQYDKSATRNQCKHSV